MILAGNCTHALYRYAADDCDIQIVDPPYAPKVHAKAVSAGTGGRGVRKRDLGFGHLTPELMMRIAWYASRVRRWTVVFTDRESAHVWRAAMGLAGVEYVRTVPWVRWSQPQQSGDRPPTGAEDILIFHRARVGKRNGKIYSIQKRWNGPGNRVSYMSELIDTDGTSIGEWQSGPVARDTYDAKSLRGKDKYSCEKPLDLMLSLVSDYSDPGDRILDSTAGFGTTCLAASLLGRHEFGLEALPDVAAAADERLACAGRRGAGLSERDEERAVRWALETRAEAERVPYPKAANGSDVKTWERAQRRLADVERIVKYGQGR